MLSKFKGLYLAQLYFKSLLIIELQCVLLEETHLALFIFTAAYEAYFKEGKALHYSNGDEVVFGEDTGYAIHFFSTCD